MESRVSENETQGENHWQQKEQSNTGAEHHCAKICYNIRSSQPSPHEKNTRDNCKNVEAGGVAHSMGDAVNHPADVENADCNKQNADRL
jgi:hypothetical protein